TLDHRKWVFENLPLPRIFFPTNIFVVLLIKQCIHCALLSLHALADNRVSTLLSKLTAYPLFNIRYRVSVTQ
ncbi:hypothetical protein ALC53_11213, partial [Atta colombica]